MRLAQSFLFVGVLTVSLATSSVGDPADPQGACVAPAPELGQMTDFVRDGCYSGLAAKLDAWTADPQRRRSSRHVDENPATMAHHFLKVHYSRSMAEWLRVNRNRDVIRDSAAIPDGATMVAEVFVSNIGGEPMEILSMVWSSGNWFFGRYLPGAADGKAKASGGVSHATCRGCHTFAGKSMVYGNYANIDGIPWQTAEAKAAPVNHGVNDPPPEFPRGDVLSTPLPAGDPAIQEFLDFFSQYTHQPVPLLSSSDIVAFPPQSLDQVHPVTSGDPQSDTYPITCDTTDCFITSDYCQGCHSSTTGGTVDELPQMAYRSGDGDLTANWSMYGEWNASIMALAARDPVWQAQIETEVNTHPGVDPAAIYTACFSCHGIMGERQKSSDLDQSFDLFNFFSTLQPNDADYDNPYPDQPGSQPEFAEYGSLARDGVSCEACHQTSPEDASGIWDGEDYSVFYGSKAPSVPPRESPAGPPYRFSANHKINHEQVLGPDPRDTLALDPMTLFEPVGIDQALDETTGESYLRSSLVCATCHVLIVPQVPTGYVPGGPIPTAEERPYYRRPGDCTPDITTFAADGVLATDPCIGLSYEMATFLEWLNSDFPARGEDLTCQGCHMPVVNDPTSDDPHKTIVAQFEDSDTTKKQFRRHRMLGINLFVHEMYQQFYDLLGVTTEDSTVPADAQFVQHNLLNAEQSIVDQATSQAFGNGGGSSAPVEIESLVIGDTMVEAHVLVTNNTGHKFPSGAGFRRGFLRFEVLDAEGNVLWVSGQPNTYGAICEGRCNAEGSNLLASEFTTDAAMLQPHYGTITRQDQVQIYGSAAVDDLGGLTSRLLSVFHGVKDNRILPDGWIPEAQCTPGQLRLGLDLCRLAAVTAPECDPDFLDCDALDNDPYYSDPALTGADRITYRIPRSDIPGIPTTARISMLYQAIPPGYLVSRYNDGYQEGEYGDATQRVIYMTSHLNLDLGLQSTQTAGPQFDLVNNDWTMTLSVDGTGPIAGPQPGACVASDTVLCLDHRAQDQRFKATMTFATVLGEGLAGDARAISLASLGVSQGGVFNFFSEKNPEVLVKVLDFCEINGHFWVFHASATNVGFELTVEDTHSGRTRTYVNPDLMFAQPVIDTQAFATCP